MTFLTKNIKLLKLIFPLLICSFYTNRIAAQKLILGSEREGFCSFYSNKFDGLKTSNGEFYDKNDMTAAHKYLPFNTIVVVTNLKTNEEVIVRINDRGPHSRKRMIDISGEAANKLGIKRLGIVKVKMRVIGFDNFQYLQPKDPIDLTAEILNSKNQ